MNYDVIIIGAGASGLAAAITAAQAGESVLVLERMPRAGKKILATGNGRCNVSNRHAATHEYHNKHFAAPALQAFGAAQCEAFFHGLGLALWEDAEGRLYPRSNMAASVLDALRFGATRAGAEMLCDTAAAQLARTNGEFVVNSKWHARRVIIAAGGCAAPAHGSDGSGFALLRDLGHTIITPKPALVQLRCNWPLLPSLKGLRVRARAALKYDDEVLRESEGEILFTDDGISGIAAMELSLAYRPGCTIELDLLPDYTHEQLENLLTQWQTDLPLAGLLPKRVAEAVVKSGQSPKKIALPVMGTRDFLHAQVTAGGADVREFDPHTLQSKLVPGLFACGEVLDVHGGCGGFNLHWAWASGVLAGTRRRCAGELAT
ncbi:MAG: aminoacetone oxidase family FAD-binding enzyme [Oscillospiraceae bacterium]|nr:aminoacetone oxidase family FAD-binding enzyme [Oscillospiraceae bacterium]